MDRYDVAEAICRAFVVEHTGFEIMGLIGWRHGEKHFDVERAQ